MHRYFAETYQGSGSASDELNSFLFASWLGSGVVSFPDRCISRYGCFANPSAFHQVWVSFSCHYLLSEQITMRSCSGEIQNQLIDGHFINQKPIESDVTFPPTCVVIFKRMVFVALRKRFFCGNRLIASVNKSIWYPRFAAIFTSFWNLVSLQSVMTATSYVCSQGKPHQYILLGIASIWGRNIIPTIWTANVFTTAFS